MPSYLTDDRLITVIFIITALALLIFIGYVVLYDGSHFWATTINRGFYEEIERESGIMALSPLLVTVAVRPSQSAGRASTDNRDRHPPYFGEAQDQPDANTAIYHTNDYAERLIVVSPQNWMIYTNNGVHFHFISNNIDLSRSHCDSRRSLSAITYRLLSVYEQASDNMAEDHSGTLRLSCIHYTYDQLMRLFGQHADKTVYYIADYFDKKKNAKAPDLTVDAILDFLIINGVV